MARVAADAGDLDGREARERLRELERAGGRRLAGAVQADVQLDEQLRRRAAALQRGREPLGRREAVDRDRQLHAVGGESGEALPLVRPERRVVHEDARRAGLLEDLGLARLRDREAAGAELELPQPDLGRLVRLRVRPERDPVRVGVGLQVLQVGLEPVEVDHRDRRLDLAQRPADLRASSSSVRSAAAAHRGWSIVNFPRTSQAS